MVNTGSKNGEWLKLVTDTALRAGWEIMKIYRTDFKVEQKTDDSPLTLADRTADEIIRKGLKDTGTPILSEEGIHLDYEKRREWEKFWLVDPLDGTKEFIHKNGEFTVNIALIEKGIPVLGVVYAPAKNWLYFGTSAIGAYKAELSSAIPFTPDYPRQKLPIQNGFRPFTIVASRSHLNGETREVLDSYRNKYPDLKTISAGSSLKLCMVAEGKADLYPRLAPTMEWDTAAGDAICRFSGCKVVDWKKEQPLIYNKKDLRNPWFKVIRND
nr:3'(2'),5'-bisphosphate nucleotidase CysQ [Saprospiraceae bacterium]